MWFKEKKKEYKNNDLLHEREKVEFLRLLNQTGEKLPQGGEDMLDVFLKTEGHISQDFFQKKLSEAGIDADPETLKNMLELLCRYGIAQKAMLNGKGPWYEHLHIGNEHDHILCAKCGKVAEITDNVMKTRGREIAKSHGFEPLVHKITILGLCPECRGKKPHLMPLSMTTPGEKVKIVRFEGGSEMRNRLNAMGLKTGEIIDVMNNSGPFILHIKGTRLAIGRGMAQKIMVSKEDER